MRRRARSAGIPCPDFRPCAESRRDRRMDAAGSAAVGVETAIAGRRARDQEAAIGRRAVAGARGRWRRPGRLPARAVRSRRRLSRRFDRLRLEGSFCGGKPLRDAAVSGGARGRHLRDANAARRRLSRRSRSSRSMRACSSRSGCSAASRTPSSFAPADGDCVLPRNVRPRRRRLHRRRRRGGDRHQPVARVGAGGDCRRAADLRAAAAHDQCGGIVLSLARQEVPDTSAYTDPEIVGSHPASRITPG